jgi:hypothetical protein
MGSWNKARVLDATVLWLRRDTLLSDPSSGNDALCAVDRRGHWKIYGMLKQLFVRSARTAHCAVVV